MSRHIWISSQWFLCNSFCSSFRFTDALCQNKGYTFAYRHNLVSLFNLSQIVYESHTIKTHCSLRLHRLPVLFCLQINIICSRLTLINYYKIARFIYIESEYIVEKGRASYASLCIELNLIALLNDKTYTYTVSDTKQCSVWGESYIKSNFQRNTTFRKMMSTMRIMDEPYRNRLPNLVSQLSLYLFKQNNYSIE